MLYKESCGHFCLPLYSRFFHDLVKGCCLSPPESVVRQWLKAIGNLTGTHIAYSPEVYKMLINRANFVNRLAKKRRVGGKQLEAFYSSKWTFKVPATNVVDALQELMKLKLDVAEQRIQELKDQLSHTSDKLRKCAEGTEGTRGKRKSLDEYSERHMRRLKKQRTTSCCASLAWLEKEGYKPVKLEIQSIESGKTETIVLSASDLEDIFGHDPTQIELDTVNMVLFIKDHFDVSGQAHHEMAKVCKQMPRHYKLKNRIAELNKLWDIRPTPNGTHGVQQSLKERLEVRLKRLVETTPSDADFKVNRNARVKLSGDGT